MLFQVRSGYVWLGHVRPGKARLVRLGHGNPGCSRLVHVNTG